MRCCPIFLDPSSRSFLPKPTENKTVKSRKEWLISQLPVSSGVKQKKRVGQGREIGEGAGVGRRWAWWRGWKMCCWRRQHPKCQSKQGLPQVCSLLAWLLTGHGTDSPKRQACIPCSHEPCRTVSDGPPSIHQLHERGENNPNKPAPVSADTLTMTHYNTEGEKNVQGPFFFSIGM